MDNGDGEEGDDEEVEEIEERMFNSQQPTKHKKTLNYTDVDDACLVQA
jgi:hypothetical protein